MRPSHSASINSLPSQRNASISHLLRFALLLWLGLSGLWGGAWAADPAALFAQLRPAIVEIEIHNAEGSPQTSASGFVVGSPDWVATNLHVVDRPLLEDRDGYQIVVLATDGVKRTAHVLAIDVAHDLAVLQVDSPIPAEPLLLATDLPPTGTPIYSLGNPAGYGVTVVPGAFAGPIADRVPPDLHATLPLDHGMSGGPTVDRMGRVVGVNQAMVGRHEQRSILSDARVLAQMIEHLLAAPSKETPQGTSTKRAQISNADPIRQQALEWSDRASADFHANSQVRDLGPFPVRYPDSEDVTCSTRPAQDSDNFDAVRQQRWRCWNHVMIQVGDDEHLIGEIQVTWTHLRNLNGAGHNLTLASDLTARLRDLAIEEPASDWSCAAQRVHVNGISADLRVCQRPIPLFDGLSDYLVFANTIPLRGEAMLIDLELNGLAADHARALIEAQLASVLQAQFPPGDDGLTGSDLWDWTLGQFVVALRAWPAVAAAFALTLLWVAIWSLLSRAVTGQIQWGRFLRVSMLGWAAWIVLGLWVTPWLLWSSDVFWFHAEAWIVGALILELVVRHHLIATALARGGWRSSALSRLINLAGITLLVLGYWALHWLYDDMLMMPLRVYGPGWVWATGVGLEEALLELISQVST